MKIFTMITLILILIGCSTTNDNLIYQEGRLFTYKIVIQENNKIDSLIKLTLSVPKENWYNFSFGQTEIHYQYIFPNNSNQIPDIEKTGVVENKDNLYLHPPRKHFMKYAEILPQPQVFFPIEKGSYQKVELQITKAELKELSGLTIKQELRVSNVETITVGNTTYTETWVLNGKNTSHIKELGQYKVTYWFDKEFGFVQMRYVFPTGKIITLKLIQVN